MTGTLATRLLDPAHRESVVADLKSVVDAEVSDKGGLSGGVVKTLYATVNKVRPGFVGSAINTMLDDFVVALEPHWAGYQAQGGTTGFGDYLAAHAAQVTPDLLAVTDKFAARYENGVVTGAYNKLRSKAPEHVTAALPRLGEIVEKHAN